MNGCLQSQIPISRKMNVYYISHQRNHPTPSDLQNRNNMFNMKCINKYIVHWTWKNTTMEMAFCESVEVGGERGNTVAKQQDRRSSCRAGKSTSWYPADAGDGPVWASWRQVKNNHAERRTRARGAASSASHLIWSWLSTECATFILALARWITKVGGRMIIAWNFWVLLKKRCDFLLENYKKD